MKSSLNPSTSAPHEDDIAIGIDIGIAYSRVTSFKNNKFTNIPDEVGRF